MHLFPLKSALTKTLTVRGLSNTDTGTVKVRTSSETNKRHANIYYTTVSPSGDQLQTYIGRLHSQVKESRHPYNDRTTYITNIHTVISQRKQITNPIFKTTSKNFKIRFCLCGLYLST